MTASRTINAAVVRIMLNDRFLGYCVCVLAEKVDGAMFLPSRHMPHVLYPY